jgi:light-regulated signal transduction histidine kinase (bacteriophytochrome)
MLTSVPDHDDPTTELAAARAALAARDDLLDELVYVISHDLTEPLRTLASSLQLLERRTDGKLDERTAELVSLAVQGAHRMGALLGDLGAYAQAGGAEPGHRSVAVQDLLDQVLVDIAPRIEEAGATVVVDGELPVVEADANAIGRLLQNLIVNAIKYARDGEAPRVTVRAWRRAPERSGWTLEVADEGPGIPPGAEERIFRVFQRLHGRDEGEGNGIGLAICRRIAERHGGSIGVKPTPGGGATFVVELTELATVEA